MTSILSVIAHVLLLISYNIFNIDKTFFELHFNGIITTGITTLIHMIILYNYDIWNINKIFLGLHFLGIAMTFIHSLSSHILIKLIDRIIIIIYITYSIMHRNIFSLLNVSYYTLNLIFGVNVYDILITYMINTSGFNVISKNKYLVS
jgi:hypothetical protein